jgi:hypothetical protein
MRLSQHYIGPKMTLCHSTFCRKSFLASQKSSFTFLPHFGGCNLKTSFSNPVDSFNKWKKFFCQDRKLFSADIQNMTEFHFWANVMLRQPHVWASPAQKSQGLRVGYSKNFSGATFVVFWGTHLVDRYLSYLSVKQIWRKSAV